MNRWRLCSVSSVLLALTWTRLAEAYRPFDGTDADVAEPHEIELEIGPVGYHRHGDDQFLVAPAIVLNYGFAPRFEAVLEGRHNWGLTSDLPLSEVEDAALS